MALRQRAEAEARYYANPNHCKQCGTMIMIEAHLRAQNAKRKTFCSHQCAGRYNNKDRVVFSKGPVTLTCQLCENTFIFEKKYSGTVKRRFCDDCVYKATLRSRGESPVLNMTKAELFAARKGYQSARSTIRRSAVESFLRAGHPLSCKACGYNKYIEVCHIKSVADFPATATIREINEATNLVALCTNHHWEFDNGHMELVAGG